MLLVKMRTWGNRKDISNKAFVMNAVNRIVGLVNFLKNVGIIALPRVLLRSTERAIHEIVV